LEVLRRAIRKSRLCQFLCCVGIQPNLLPPRHPELNAYVERVRRLGADEIAG